MSTPAEVARELKGSELDLMRKLSAAQAEMQGVDAMMDLAAVPKLPGGTPLDRVRHLCDELVIARAFIRQLQRQVEIAGRHVPSRREAHCAARLRNSPIPEGPETKPSPMTPSEPSRPAAADLDLSQPPEKTPRDTILDNASKRTARKADHEANAEQDSMRERIQHVERARLQRRIKLATIP